MPVRIIVAVGVLDDDRMIAQARAFRDRGLSFREIAERLGVSKPTVGRLLTGDPLYGSAPDAKRRAERAPIRLAPIASAALTPTPVRKPLRLLPLPELGADQVAGLGVVFDREPRAKPAHVDAPRSRRPSFRLLMAELYRALISSSR